MAWDGCLGFADAMSHRWLNLSVAAEAIEYATSRVFDGGHVFHGVVEPNAVSIPRLGLCFERELPIWASAGTTTVAGESTPYCLRS